MSLLAPCRVTVDPFWALFPLVGPGASLLSLDAGHTCLYPLQINRVGCMLLINYLRCKGPVQTKLGPCQTLPPPLPARLSAVATQHEKIACSRNCNTFLYLLHHPTPPRGSHAYRIEFFYVIFIYRASGRGGTRLRLPLRWKHRTVCSDLPILVLVRRGCTNPARFSHL